MQVLATATRDISRLNNNLNTFFVDDHNLVIIELLPGPRAACSTGARWRWWKQF